MTEAELCISCMHFPPNLSMSFLYIAMNIDSFVNVFEKRLLCAPWLHLFDQKYSETVLL